MKTNEQTPLIRIVDDDEEVRESLKLMLECEGYEVAAYADGPAFLRDLNGARPGCILLDVRMPQLSGPEVQGELARRASRLPVVFITSFSDIDVAINTLKSGAVDFLLKPVDPDKLLAVIEKAVAKSRLSAQGVTVPENLSATLASLSEQPRRVLQLMMEDLKDDVIAERLGVSPRTAQVYRATVYKALGVHSVKQFALLKDALREALAAMA